MTKMRRWEDGGAGTCAIYLHLRASELAVPEKSEAGVLLRDTYFNEVRPPV